MNKFLFILILVGIHLFSYSQSASVFGRVDDQLGNQLEGVIVRNVNESSTAVSTNSLGEYRLSIPANKQVHITIQYTGYLSQLVYVQLKDGEQQKLNIQLKLDENVIDDVLVEGNQTRDVVSGFSIDSEDLFDLPAVSGGVETLIKTLPGVQSSNELSSQYNVRGGSFDENVVLINGFEIIRPQLIRSGNQEGLSVINSEMTDEIYFSAGGFEPQFGDKLSSVLNISYLRPEIQKGSANVGLLGAGMHLENQSKNKKAYYKIGGRYKTNKYLLNSLEENGEYNPVSYDLQGVFGLDVSQSTTLELFGLTNKTSYEFEPVFRSTNFGQINDILTFNAAIDGEENDEFSSDLIGLRSTTRKNNVVLDFSTSYQQNKETESIDFLTNYLLGNINQNDIDTLATGLQTELVNNKLNGKIFQLNHQGFLSSDNKKHYLAWGAGYKLLDFTDNIQEFDQLQSFKDGTNDTTFNELISVDASGELTNHIVNGFVQDTWLPSGNNFSITGGFRVSNSSFTNETLVSPRLQTAFEPNWDRDVIFKAAVGLYQQHPLYREYRNIKGDFNSNIKAQKSFHAIVGSDYNFTMGDRPFNFTSELYYKDNWDVIPYEYDGLRIRYLGKNNATAYAAGADFRLYGEFVEDAPSWLSLSFLKTEEEIDGERVRRPTDQRMNFSVFWQDYFSTNKNFKVNFVGEFGGRLPTGIADGNRLNDDFSLPSYKRIDIGFSANLKGTNDARLPYSPFKDLKSLWLSAEIFNLFNIDNTSSYQWVFTPQGETYSVPNFLTSRRLNAKISLTF